MANEGNNILKYNHYQKSIKVPLTIYVGFEAIPKKTCACGNNPETSRLKMINKDLACGFSVFVKYSYDNSTNEKKIIEEKIFRIKTKHILLHNDDNEEKQPKSIKKWN